MLRRFVTLLTVSMGITGLGACDRSGPPTSGTLRAQEVAVASGDPARGQRLVEHFECARCHAGVEPTPPIQKACVTCHAQIVEGTFPAAPAALQKWQPIVRDLRFAPSLEGAGRFRSSWLTGYLTKPNHLRPSLALHMPRLDWAPNDVSDVVAFLKTAHGSASVTALEAKPDLVMGDAERGRTLLGSKGCMTCHRLTGGPSIPASPLPTAIPPAELERGMVLAPDLRSARERLTPAMLAAWIEKPSRLKPHSDMPDVPMTATEARDVATFLYTVPLSVPPPKPFTRLPPLSRPVRFDEVNAKVFHRTCWHCHSEPDFAIGDGGPGNSGGLGFRGRGVDLSSYQGLMAGFVTDDEGGHPLRKSLFVAANDGLPRLLSALVARHNEEAGAATADVRGMPLGLAPLSAEDIQLIETWIVQGKLR